MSETNRLTNPALPAPKKGWMQKSRSQKRIFLFLAITPAFGGYLLFTLYPNLMSVYYSLLNWNGISEPQFVGLQNYVTLFQDKYVWRALYHNLIYMIFVPALVIMISLLLAYLLTNKSYKGTPIFKVLFFFPNVLSSVVVALLWAFVYDGSFGLLNSLLRLVGVNIGEFYWLGDIRTALWAIIPPYVWAGVGFYVVIFMNAMVTIPKSLYESAILDGATPMTRLFKITIPLIMPIIRVGALFLVLGSLKGFEHVLILTNGGPAGSTDVIGLYMFNLAFGAEYHNYGYASAVGMFLFVVLVIAKFITDKYMTNRSVEY
ncbi:carbohydrate ABC transporter permease [Paenibacillus contaminans]|uniref:Sugar ABC transporter permease n=1 Tax=Paenibacillus contaminans TaxID=450362 RepID=A0A329MGU4_9BACL|nr:sugar ABC transporter permease [Paenibacillus contaminans]RAV17883.1 sugar ABC transporter permease [Paenibacillus contaminans]